MQKPKVIIRADGNAKIGLGHIHRTLALTEYLKDNFEICFYSYEADELVNKLISSKGFEVKSLTESDLLKPSVLTNVISKKDIVVLDGYYFKTGYQEALKSNGNKIVAIDDLNQWENVADAVINHGYSGSDYKLSAPTKFYGGLDYAIIKQEILNSKNKKQRTEAKKVLVCIGGTDPDNYSEKIIKELLDETDKIVSLLTYPINPKFESLKKSAAKNNARLKLFHSINARQLIELVSNNDIAILQPSNIALEAAAIGICINLVQTAENQKYILETLINAHCAVKLDLENIAEQINSTSVEEINAEIENQFKLLDGRSPSRILDIFNSLLLECRKVNIDDIKLIYEWNNDEVTRANSFSTAKIEYGDHEKWFTNKINDPKTCFLLFTYNGAPAGCVRIECKENENVIGITMAPEMRGKKLASLVLKMAAEYFEKYFEGTGITAYIKKKNIPSIKGFEKAGYRILDSGDYCNEESYKLIKTLHEHI